MRILHFTILLLIICSAASCSRKKEKITVLFDRVDGVAEGSPVLNKGITVGEVKNMNILNNKVIVDITLKNDVKIPAQSIFSIDKKVFGGSNINVEYSGNASFLTSADTVMGEYKEKGVMESLVTDTTKRNKMEKSMKKIAEGIGELIQAARDTTNKPKTSE